MLQPTNSAIAGLEFPFGFFPGNLWVWSISLTDIGSPIDLLNTSITCWLVFSLDSSSVPCNRRQFRRKFCSCLSITESMSSNLLLRVLMFSFSSFISCSFSRLSCSYSWNFSLIKLTDSYRSVSWVVPLICFSCVACAISQRIFVSFAKFCKQLNKMLTHSWGFNPSAKTSVFSETDESFKLPSRCFLLDSLLSSELLLKSLLLLLKKFIISKLVISLWLYWIL